MCFGKYSGKRQRAALLSSKIFVALQSVLTLAESKLHQEPSALFIVLSQCLVHLRSVIVLEWWDWKIKFLTHPTPKACYSWLTFSWLFMLQVSLAAAPQSQTPQCILGNGNGALHLGSHIKDGPHVPWPSAARCSSLDLFFSLNPLRTLPPRYLFPMKAPIVILIVAQHRRQWKVQIV